MMFVLFGVKNRDLEVSKSWVEDVTQLAAEGRHNDYDGDYYKFGIWGEEWLRLTRSWVTDQDETYAKERSFPKWKYFLYVNNTCPESRVLQALDARPDLFEKLRVETSINHQNPNAPTADKN